MKMQDQNQVDLLAFKWFSVVTFMLMAWGMLAGFFAFKYQVPLDSFSILFKELNLEQSLVVGLVYGLVASFILVILGTLGYYNPVMAFVIFLTGIIIFLDFIVGNTVISESKNLIWIMVLPFVIIRDLVTYSFLRKSKSADTAHKKIDGTRTQENFF